MKIQLPEGYDLNNHGEKPTDFKCISLKTRDPKGTLVLVSVSTMNNQKSRRVEIYRGENFLGNESKGQRSYSRSYEFGQHPKWVDGVAWKLNNLYHKTFTKEVMQELLLDSSFTELYGK